MTAPRASLVRLSRRSLRLHQILQQRHQSSISSSTTSQPQPQPQASKPQPDPYDLLSTPTWSTRALFPTSLPPPLHSQPSETDLNTSNDKSINIPHLLRLSALPQPSSPAETARLQSTLQTQLHFVRAIQLVNTDGVAPLRSIRDETRQGLREAAITSDTPQIRAALAEEEAYGRWKRPRRRRALNKADGGRPLKGVEDWDVLGSAREKVGRYFVVRSGSGRMSGDEVAGE
ncbi:60S ribosomal protein L7 [Madurella fahalii]|uniref:60S ribosomal protein L7 n=1 Tax=Madurella fahalii TaxID=1157608 RepID=A0ABQ0G5M5_9PEZI